MYIYVCMYLFLKFFNSVVIRNNTDKAISAIFTSSLADITSSPWMLKSLKIQLARKKAANQERVRNLRSHFFPTLQS